MLETLTGVLKSLLRSVLTLVGKVLAVVIRIALLLVAIAASVLLLIAIIIYVSNFFAHTTDVPKIASWPVIVGEIVLIIAITYFFKYEGDYWSEHASERAEKRTQRRARAAAARAEARLAKQVKKDQAESAKRYAAIKARLAQYQQNEASNPPGALPFTIISMHVTSPSAHPQPEPPPPTNPIDVVIAPATASPIEAINTHLEELMEKARQNPPKRRMSKREQRDRARDYRYDHPPTPESQTVKLDNEL